MGALREWWDDQITRLVDPVHDSRILHGDPRLANIIVDSTRSTVTLIDYANGRRGHVFEDFARFELDLLFRCVPRAEGLDEIDRGCLLDFLGFLLKDQLDLGDETEADRSLKCLRLWRRAMVHQLGLLTKHGALQMYRCFLLR